MAPKAKHWITCHGIVNLSFAVLFASFAWGTPQAPQQNQPPQEKKQIDLLAVVNGQQITRHQVATECMRRFGEDVLESIIKKYLVLDQCRRNGIVITEKDVNDDIVAKAKKFGWSADRYIQTICNGKNISVDRLKNDVIWHELAIRRLASQNMDVTKDEIAERMEFEFGAKVQVRQIVVDSQQLADQILAQLQTNPDSFERLAKQFSVDTMSKSIGGLLQPIRRNSGLPEFENLAFSLQPGQVSSVFHFAEKYIILRGERLFPAEELSPEQITYAHDRVREEITRAKLTEAARGLFERMKTDAQIVNVMNDPKLSQEMPGVAAIVNGTKILKNRVGEESITRFGTTMIETEINRTILLQALKKAGKQVEQSDMDAEIARAAEAIGHLNKDGSVNIDQWLAYVTNNDLSKVDFYIEDEVWPTAALKKLVESKVTVTQEDMDKAFEANFGPRVEVLALVADNHRNATNVWNMASRNPTSEFFGKLANQYSTDPASKNNFGVVPPIQKHGGRPELEKEAFGLQAGELSKVIQVGEHWVILFCVGRTDPVVQDFDAVKDELYKNILEKKMRLAMVEEIQGLRENAQIDNFLTGTSQPGRAAVQSARQMESGTPGGVPFRGQRR